MDAVTLTMLTRHLFDPRNSLLNSHTNPCPHDYISLCHIIQKVKESHQSNIRFGALDWSVGKNSNYYYLLRCL